ncbi:MAG: mRNA cap guanine-N7 methyltransferase [Piccolia ochrophora]|nr:MAG: mRNA cap guanine-N7 methyltransferase [Piccolia ochrophora]
MYDPARDIFTSSEEAAAADEKHADNADNLRDTPPEGQVGGRDIRQHASPPKETASPPIHSSRHKSSLEIPTYGEQSNGDNLKEPLDARHALNPSHEAPRERAESSRKRTRSPEMSSNARPDLDASTTQQAVERGSSEARDAATNHRSPRPAKKQRTTPPREHAASQDYPLPMTSANLPAFSRKGKSKDASNAQPRRSSTHNGTRRDRSRSPQRQANARWRERRSPPRRRSPSPAQARRSPSPPPRSPPRKLKRPGGASRLTAVERDAVRQRQLEREKAEIQSAQIQAATRGVHDVVRQHYNAVPERGRDWRKTDSRIKGLRSFNNWVKSTIIQKFSANEDFNAGGSSSTRFAEGMGGGGLDGDGPRGLSILDIGCGKGGDLFKWQQAPQSVDLYVGVDPAEVSIQQAQDRYKQMRDGGGRGGRGGGGRRSSRRFHAEFFVKDAFGEWLGDIPLIQEVGIDGSAGPGGGGAASSRWGGGGFDVVSMMFCMHYAFESESKARGMLRNVAGSLKKGGRFLGVIPNSDVLTDKVSQFHETRNKVTNGTTTTTSDPQQTGEPKGDEARPDQKEDGEAEEVPQWGNSIYRVRFPGKTPDDGVFRPPFGWKYSYFMEEAVEEVPEYVVPWEAFRFIAEDYNLELRYREPFADIWRKEKDDPILGPLSERMGVRERGRGGLAVSDEEMEAASFYHAFCFYKV